MVGLSKKKGGLDGDDLGPIAVGLAKKNAGDDHTVERHGGENEGVETTEDDGQVKDAKKETQGIPTAQQNDVGNEKPGQISPKDGPNLTKAEAGGKLIGGDYVTNSDGEMLRMIPLSEFFIGLKSGILR